jgi:hypothetical protein
LPFPEPSTEAHCETKAISIVALGNADARAAGTILAAPELTGIWASPMEEMKDMLTKLLVVF